MSRRFLVLAFVGVCGAATSWLALRPGDRPAVAATATATDASTRPTVRVGELPALATGSAHDGATQPEIRFEERLPLEYRPAAVKSAVSDFQDWLAANYPHAKATFLGADCTVPPCMLGVTFSNDGFGDAVQLRAFHKGVRAELERRVGWSMTTTLADEDKRGGQYIWMYGLPADVDHELAQALNDNAFARHQMRMDPIRVPVPPAIPGPGEPGYQE